MASLSADLKLVLLALGEEGYGAYTNYGDVENANWEIVEDKLGGQSAISVTTADVTLTDAQQQTLHLNLSGALTGNRNIVLKASQKGMFFVTNGTSGAYTITIKPSAGTGVVLDQGKRAWIYSDGSTASFVTKLGDLLQQETISSDADFTLTWGTNAESIKHTGTLTANRAVTLSTSGAVKGARWRITRSGSGAFNLNIGTGPLIALLQNMWAEVVYDGSAWYLDKHGFTNMSAFAQTFLDDADAAAVRATLGISNGAFVQIGSKQTISSPVSQVVFSNIPSSGYSKFVLVGTNVISARTGVTNETAFIQVSTDNGSTWKTTSGDYYSATSASTNLVVINLPAVDSTFQYGSFVIEFVGLGNSSRATTGAPLFYDYGISATSVSRSAIADTSIKKRVAAEADNAIRLISATGNNLSAGTLTLYGVTET